MFKNFATITGTAAAMGSVIMAAVFGGPIVAFLLVLGVFSLAMTELVYKHLPR